VTWDEWLGFVGVSPSHVGGHPGCGREHAESPDGSDDRRAGAAFRIARRHCANQTPARLPGCDQDEAGSKTRPTAPCTPRSLSLMRQVRWLEGLAKPCDNASDVEPGRADVPSSASCLRPRPPAPVASSHANAVGSATSVKSPESPSEWTESKFSPSESPASGSESQLRKLFRFELTRPHVNPPFSTASRRRPANGVINVTPVQNPESQERKLS
jgi:hypothetical protein